MQEVGEYKKHPNSDKIICPALAAAVNHGILVPDEDGVVTGAQLENVLKAYGFASDVAENGTYKAAFPGMKRDPSLRINIYKLNSKKAYPDGQKLSVGYPAHHTSSGFRNPGNDSEGNPDSKTFETFIDEYMPKDGIMTLPAFGKFVLYCRTDLDRIQRGNPNSLDGAMPIAVSLLFNAFGRVDKALKGDLYFTESDLRSLYLEGKIPEDWKAKNQIPKTSVLIKITPMLGLKKFFRVAFKRYNYTQGNN